MDLNTRVEAEVGASRTSLREIFGVGPILAATILRTAGEVGRFPTKAKSLVADSQASLRSAA